MLLDFTVDKVLYYDLNGSMQIAASLVISDDRLLWTIERKSLSFCARTQFGDIIQTEHHVLRRNGDRSTISWVQDVMALEHQYLGFQNGLVAQREVHSHLVTVKVGIERSTSQRVKLNSLTLNELRLECHH